MSKKNKLLLIDGNSVAFRAFYALYQALNNFKNRNGLHTNAIYAFHNMFDNVLEKEKPTHVLVAFDAGKTTFRHDTYTDYKAGRSKTPSEFKEQMPYIRELVEAFGVKHFELMNYEADDIIGTLAKQVPAEQFDVVIISGDKDLTQLADEHIRVDVTVKGVSELESYTPEHIREKYELTPAQIIDMKGLAGDNSDNLPGVTGIGEKTAIKLLKEYGTVEGVYDHIDEMKKSKRKENLINDREQAFMSKQLATIHTDVPLPLKVEDLAFNGKNVEHLVQFYKEMDFNSFLAKLDTSEYGALEEPLPDVTYELVTEVTDEMLTDDMVMYMEMLEENYHVAPIEGIAFSNGKKTYVMIGEEVFENAKLRKWLASNDYKKQVFNAKSYKVALNRRDIDLQGVSFDTLIAAYLLDTNDKNEDLAEIASHYDYHQIETDEQVYGKGAKCAVPETERFAEHLARKVAAMTATHPLMLERLEEYQQTELFYEMELPLSLVLAKMEMAGIKVDASRLETMQVEFAERLKEIEQRVFEIAGEEFNLNSPKQLGVILFEKMKLPVIKKTKTGYSTAVDVLEQLKTESPIIDEILDYRQIMKIQSTYVEGLLKVIHPGDQKIHTRYVQTLTQTGRLSSVDPNLQNIPVRLEEGRKIRQAFVPRKEGWKIYASDYSQIELRVLAHISEDEHLIQAFVEDQDIHASTARRVFGLDETATVDGNLRRQAKAVNFGVVYGISDYGLSQNLGITRKEAKHFIDTYFEKYPGVKTYMEDIVREAKDKGYVETLWHRRRFLPDINARNFNIRSFAERTAINTPIQGSAADILKLAMIELDKRIEAEGLQATMLLQVHDELVFEAPANEIPALEKLVTDVMETITTLRVPLRADSSYGDTWYDAK
ncbi:DNA polymerase I [Vagococcus lutrae]|uniref:DNA polymerase I n=1 Tax=Vagococcus lutrae TaxID=81947 RepID=UPI00288D2B88|nr:DNA polymerase I [Vagococcus lutrae]MDT2800719.1 DNA polymerase I [Vagococcus lutrae]MDT2825562.1 DNA polymerase I [Vagococcus lutrae]MDT2841980.1 DNA polymerase I [Vagococcus lutrae]